MLKLSTKSGFYFPLAYLIFPYYIEKMLGIVLGIALLPEGYMPKQKRIKTQYKGVFYINVDSISYGRNEKVFYIIYRKHGKLIEEKAGRQFSDNMTASKANRIRAMRIEGHQLSNRERREKAAQINLKKKIWTIESLWNEFHYQKTEDGLRSINDDVSRYRKYLSEKFGDKEPKDLTPKEIDDLRIELSRRLKPASVRQVLMLLQRIINFGFKKQLIPPLSFKIQMPKVNNLKTEDLTKEQLNSLLQVLEEESHTVAANIMKLALFTGMRRMEIFNLQWDDIDFERGFIHIRNPKGGVDVKIPLNDKAREVIQNQPKMESPYIFQGRFGGRIYDLSTSVNRIKKKAGLPADFRPLHGLRHVYASILASSGQVDLYTLQKLLTHKSPQMTQRYAHLRDETLQKASNLMSKIINSAENS
ncbi:tyrosine-type recombinase/integrase [candidate division KSB1 bacterium]